MTSWTYHHFEITWNICKLHCFSLLTTQVPDALQSVGEPFLQLQLSPTGHGGHPVQPQEVHGPGPGDRRRVSLHELLQLSQDTVPRLPQSEQCAGLPPQSGGPGELLRQGRGHQLEEEQEVLDLLSDDGSVLRRLEPSLKWRALNASDLKVLTFFLWKKKSGSDFFFAKSRNVMERYMVMLSNYEPWIGGIKKAQSYIGRRRSHQ